MLRKLCLLLLLVTYNNCIYTTINSKPRDIVFKYFHGIRGEGSLRECSQYEACSAVHKRYWMPTVSERLCRCPGGTECPWHWTRKPDKSSMALNNRSHLKFCAPITLDTCTSKQSALVVYGKGDIGNNYMTPHNATVSCRCSETNYWRLQKFTYGENEDIAQTYRCVKQKMCESLEFCGHVRPDLYSVYYRCTCPLGHMCIYKDKSQHNVQELLYSGRAYKARCYPS